MFKGYTGKILNINLATGNIEVETIEEEVLRKYLGGSGLAAKLLYDMTDENTDPLGPFNPLIYMTGPFAGTRVPTSGRHEIVAKSPLTGIYGEGDVGGTWGLNLKKAGYDGIVIECRSEKPVYILIDNGDVEILDGNNLWGLDTYETDQALKEIHGSDFVTSCIGPAGEKQVPLACIMHNGRDARAVGRTGLGAVMGSKNLKAVVVRGKGTVPVADEESLKASIKKFVPGLVEKTKAMNLLGTSGGVIASEKIGDLPIKNWKEGNWKDAQLISGQRMAETILKKQYYCGSCPIGCGREVEIEKGPYAGVKGAGPEYETLGLLGSSCLINDLEAIAYMNELCNRMGIDTISAGSAIAFAMELYEHKVLAKDEFDRIDLTWGNVEAAIEVIKKIASCEGIGKLLGRGVKKASEEIGGISQEFAIHVKGLELPAHDPRCFTSLAVGYATGNRGACHLQGASYFFEKTAVMPELGYNEPFERLTSEGKGKLNFHAQNLMGIMDSLKMCKFTIYGGVGLSNLVEWLKYVTGWDDITMEELLASGERIFNLKRMYNVRCGISRKDDTLPMRILTQPRRDEGTGENLPHLGKMLNEYYEARGWTDEGIPKEATLKRLGLLDV